LVPPLVAWEDLLLEVAVAVLQPYLLVHLAAAGEVLRLPYLLVHLAAAGEVLRLPYLPGPYHRAHLASVLLLAAAGDRLAAGDQLPLGRPCPG
jgi:hypothetical protein